MDERALMVFCCCCCCCCCCFGLVSLRPRQQLGYITDGPPDRTSDSFTCCRQSCETMTFISAGHIILRGRPQRESSPGPPHQESPVLPTELPRPHNYSGRIPCNICETLPASLLVLMFFFPLYVINI